jgi:hypothetical protein
VTEAGVAHVMRLFMKHYAETAPAAPAAAAPDASAKLADAMQAAADVVCEVELLGKR